MNFENLKADVESQPITGWLPDGRYIDIPLISHIMGGLYVGGYGDVDLGDTFDHIYSLYHWEKYRFGANTQYHAVEMYDSRTDPIDVESVNRFADEINEALDAGCNVLVHCQAGINRSNLVAATVLKKRYNMTGEKAIALLREKRSPLVLANKTFENYLLG